MAQAVIEFAMKPRAHGRQEDVRAGAATGGHRGHAERGAGAVASCLSIRTDLAARGHGGVAAGFGRGDVVPRQVSVVTEFPWLDKMRSEEDDAEDNAQASNNDVGDAKEVVATTHNGASGDDDGLFASVFGGREEIVDNDLVASLSHRLGVVALVELAESWQTSSTHPDLERLPLLKIRRRVSLGITVRITQTPVGWRNDFAQRLRGWVVQISVTAPGNVGVVGHEVCLRLVATASGGVQQLGAGVGVVEHGVGNESARIVRLLDAVDSLTFQRGAFRAVDIAPGPVVSLELVDVERIGVSTMVLVKVGELVVEQNRGSHALGDVESQIASLSRHLDARVDWNIDVGLDGPLRINRRVGGFELSLYIAAGHGAEAPAVVVGRSIGCAVGVIQANLLHLGAGIKQQAADWSEYDADGEEERQNCLWSKNWLPGFESLLSKGRVRRATALLLVRLVRGCVKRVEGVGMTSPR